MPQLGGTVVASALAAAGAAYLNAKYGIGTDVRQLLRDRDFSRRLQQYIARLGDHPTLMHILELAKDNEEALWFEGNTWTYSEMKKEVDNVCGYLIARGVKSGDIVAVFMSNSPEMVFTIYALSKIGAVAALINSSLRETTLAHCLQVAGAKLVIATPDIAKFAEKAASTDDNAEIFHLNISSFGPKRTLPQSAGLRSHAEICPKKGLWTPCLLIYTSGTSGKPKAVAIPNFRLTATSLAVSEDFANPKKYFPCRTYTCMPLFHGTSIFGGLCYSVGSSGTLCIARKFSASGFFKDLHDSRATQMLYVGELCRYLLASPPSQYDRDHKVIVAYGNGLRKDIWRKFQDRFGIPEIREIYRSTEGLYKFDNNHSGQIGEGKVGFAGPLKRWLENDTLLLKFDEDQQDLYRDSNGRCVRAAISEPGEVVARIRAIETLPAYYGNPDATDAKIVRDVFEKGDMFQRSGDLLVHDADGWVRFHDRIGDSFRWRGENVSAGEIRTIVSQVPSTEGALVYGAKLERYEGQAGAAAIKLKDRTTSKEAQFMSNLYLELKQRGTPSYAIPRLVRITDNISTNASFKYVATEMKGRSWKPTEAASKANEDTLYWLDGENYAPLTTQAWKDIEAGKARL